MRKRSDQSSPVANKKQKITKSQTQTVISNFFKPKVETPSDNNVEVKKENKKENKVTKMILDKPPKKEKESDLEDEDETAEEVGEEEEETITKSVTTKKKKSIYTPLEQQYMKIKANHTDVILGIYGVTQFCLHCISSRMWLQV